MASDRFHVVFCTSAECGKCYAYEPNTKAPILKCSRCKLRYYCTKDCQKADWPSHKAFCNSIHTSPIKVPLHPKVPDFNLVITADGKPVKFTLVDAPNSKPVESVKISFPEITDLQPTHYCKNCPAQCYHQLPNGIVKETISTSFKAFERSIRPGPGYLSTKRLVQLIKDETKKRNFKRFAVFTDYFRYYVIHNA